MNITFATICPQQIFLIKSQNRYVCICVRWIPVYKDILFVMLKYEMETINK